MFFTRKFKTGLAALTLALVVVLAAPTFARNTSGTAQEQVADQLEKFKRTAYRLSHEADNLNAHTPGQLSWNSHTRKLNTLKDHVNEMGRTLAELEALKAFANESQGMAIEHGRAHLVPIAQNVTQAIESVNENRHSIRSAEYSEAVSNIYEHADALYTKLDTILDFESAKVRLEALELQAAPSEGD